ncbi:transglutaminase family protein [Paenibacillus sp. GCM10027626]|uniref:transglutaminase-like domain-containing protein n=1 Tax=Paenibacillus sp. GCM10027626 TaxID=3273411 RepID=UPI003631353F
METSTVKAGQSGQLRQPEKAPNPEPSFFQGFSCRFVASLLLFGIFVEWLLPLQQLAAYTELNRLSPVIAAVGCFLFIGLLALPPWAVVLLNGAICFGSIGVFYSEEINPLIGASHAVKVFSGDALKLLSGDFALGGETRTLLLIAGVGMIAVSMQALMWLRQWGLGLAGLTALYLLLLHSFLGLQVYAGLVRALAEGLLLNMLLLLPRLHRLYTAADATADADAGFDDCGSTGGERSKLAGWPVHWWKGAAWLTALLLFAGVLISAAGVAEEAGQPSPWAARTVNWAKNALFAQAALSLQGAGKRDAEAFTRQEGMGYGADDRALGGPVTLRNDPLFVARSEQPHYWRAESKDYYDGRGWRQYAQSMSNYSLYDLNLEPQDAGGTRLMYSITALHPKAGWPLLTADSGAEAKVYELALESGQKRRAQYRKDDVTGTLYMSDAAERAREYKIVSAASDRFGLAKQASGGAQAGEAQGAEAGDPADIVRLNTQLPAGLPARVRQLADELAAKAGGDRYETAVAIEAYLKSAYPYDLQHSQVPPAGQDFVDHFLFEQRSGYCVHFATAMVVLLRTQGIPARYVKGFAPGEGEPQADGISRFTLRASDAHAWAEVYFPGTGWVAFEPTPGFAGPRPAGPADARASAAAPLPEQPAARAGMRAAAAAAAAFRDAAGKLQAAALQAAWQGARGAHALMRSAAGADAAAAGRWLGAGLAAAATGAAAVWAALWRRSERGAFAIALRRYGSAVRASRGAAARAQWEQLAAGVWRELYRRCGAPGPGRTAREYAAALELPPQEAASVAAFVAWDELARYSADWELRAERRPAAVQIARIYHLVRRL